LRCRRSVIRSPAVALRVRDFRARERLEKKVLALVRNDLRTAGMELK
jgi:hypothetical protein